MWKNDLVKDNSAAILNHGNIREEFKNEAFYMSTDLAFIYGFDFDNIEPPVQRADNVVASWPYTKMNSKF